MIANAHTRFVYFDMGNVLLNFDHQIACRQIAQAADLPEDQVAEVIFHSELQTKYESGELDTQQFYDAFCRATDRQPALPEFLRAGSDIFTLNVMMVPIVTQLRRAGYRLGILSNTCDAHWQFIRRHRYTMIEQFFHVYALSFELHDMKPNKSIYEKALALTKLPADQVLFIDDREENVAAAAAFGIDAILHESAFETSMQLRDRGLLFNY